MRESPQARSRPVGVRSSPQEQETAEEKKCMRTDAGCYPCREGLLVIIVRREAGLRLLRGAEFKTCALFLIRSERK
jgi:hypothetical protein